MATVVVSLKLMPESPDINLSELQAAVSKAVRTFGGLDKDDEVRCTLEPIAFGLNSLIVLFAMDEKKGSTEPLEKALSALEGVSSVEVTDVRRAVG
ncbi:elongation factor 1-beta [archaeon]|nr:elongation factor 1-beta [archaeon]